MDTFTLHGFTGSPENWRGIARGTHLGLLGHTEATHLATQCSFLDETRRIHGKLSKGCHLIGYSLGARLALSVAIECPKRVAMLTLIGGHSGLSLPSEREERLQNDAKWSACLRQKGITAFVDQWQALSLWDTQKSLPNERRAILRKQRLSHAPSQLALALDSVGLGNMPNYAPQLSELTLPVHLITGELDAKFARLADQMAAKLPLVRHSVIPNCGHNPLIEAPLALRDAITEGANEAATPNHWEAKA